VNRNAPLAFYVPLFGVGVAVAWLLSPLVLDVVSPSTVGMCFTALFAAIYLGELKQESIGQLYQALAVSNLQSSEQASLNEAGLRKIRQIRRIFLLSNVVKAVGAVCALYLTGEKTPLLSPATVVAAAAFALWVAVILFARLWAEVSASERLLISSKIATMLAQRREAFLAESSKAESHDFDSDVAAKSFSQQPEEIAWSDLK
jgi:hypothetical protein